MLLEESESKRIFRFSFLLLIISLLFCNQLFAHPNYGQLSKLSRTDTAFIYLQLGFTHILPLGLDHILFVLSLFLLNPKLKPVIWQATTFTVAHTITLGLSMYGAIKPASYIIEPIIALSIMFVALENIITDKLRPTRIAVVFAFGLIHGMGFASALKDLGLPQNRFFTGLFSFNIGVEIGQLTIIIAAWLLFGKWFGDKKWYRKRIVYPVSAIIAAIAFGWTIQRVFFP
jgi:HupE / UreJ protein